MKKIVIGVLLLNLAACADQPVKPVETPASPRIVDVAQESPVESAVVQAEYKLHPLEDPNSILASRSMYYPLDEYVVQEADKAVVQAHARYLAEHPDRQVRLEGHADERGSNEYNLALGQRRANGVKNMLVLGGAKSSQIETASYGEEKPKASGHVESAWAQNRRTDLIYK